MATHLRPLKIRHHLGRTAWGLPRPFGDDGWVLDHVIDPMRVVVSCAPYDPDQVEWVHASISHAARMPTYHDLAGLHRAVYEGYAYQVFAPSERHINLHPYALHLWGRLDGAAALPDFTLGGFTI